MIREISHLYYRQFHSSNIGCNFFGIRDTEGRRQSEYFFQSLLPENIHELIKHLIVFCQSFFSPQINLCHRIESLDSDQILSILQHILLENQDNSIEILHGSCDMNRVFARFHDLIEMFCEDYPIFNVQILLKDRSCEDCGGTFTHDDLISSILEQNYFAIISRADLT